MENYEKEIDRIHQRGKSEERSSPNKLRAFLKLEREEPSLSFEKPENEDVFVQ